MFERRIEYEKLNVFNKIHRMIRKSKQWPLIVTRAPLSNQHQIHRSPAKNALIKHIKEMICYKHKL